MSEMWPIYVTHKKWFSKRIFCSPPPKKKQKQKLCVFRTKKKWQIVVIHMYMKIVHDKWCCFGFYANFAQCVCSMPSIFYSLCVDIELKKTSASKLTIYVCINWTQWMLTFRFSRSVVFLLLFCLAGLCRMLRRNSLDFYKLHLSFFVIVYIFGFYRKKTCYP